jgi:hypothetical protein
MTSVDFDYFDDLEDFERPVSRWSSITLAVRAALAVFSPFTKWSIPS